MENLVIKVSDLINWSKLENEVKDQLQERGIEIMEQEFKFVNTKLDQDSYNKLKEVLKSKYGFLTKKDAILLQTGKAIQKGKQHLLEIDTSFFKQKGKSCAIKLEGIDLVEFENVKNLLGISKDGYLLRYLIHLLINE